MTLSDRLREDAYDFYQVAVDQDCRPIDTKNWQHMLNAREAADKLEELEYKLEFARVTKY